MKPITELNLDPCRMRLYGGGASTDTLLWLMGEESFSHPPALPEGTGVIAVSGQDWDRDFSPWPAPGAFRGQSFSGGAEAYLRKLTDAWIPQALEAFALRPARQGILGYSLAGLFSVYALSMSGVFSLGASVSGSLWYDGFTDWLSAHPPVRPPEKLYFSVGDQEKKSRNPRLRQVEDCTIRTAEWAKSVCGSVCFELNRGGHFDRPEERLHRAVRFLLTGSPEES